ncbi:acyl-CoA synthetase (AMP-forming)/AMP-acid ligase II [Actinoplanes tereljensis]|uniref:Acyl-CoA synthetase n=1 Tax=Paractinoplanes tereljensis TaxID=571912 RepID=A0A919NPT5_9ACTN|nr:AMP-binding protein [Actinoplanes tereljensis]GIF22108.1 hypothetical protein Ate02nite_48380 [Actinoplanes tereljensis]
MLLTALLDSADLGDALVTPSGRYSRHDLLGWAASIARDIAGAPIVAIDAVPDASTIAAVAGALLAGVPIVPIPPDAGTLERQHILTDSGAALLLSDSAGAGAIPISRSDRETTIPAAPPPSQAGLVLYTSGTTGKPKGVVISRAAIAADLDALAEAWDWTAADRLVHGLPLYHVHGLVLGALGPLRIGGRLTHTGRPAPEAYAQSSGTIYFGVPTVWSRVAAQPAAARALAPARLLVSGSAPLPSPVFHDLLALTGQAPVERYGMTETLITVSARAAGERRPGQVGLPLTGIESRLVDEKGAPIPADGSTIGQLQIRGATMFDGYLRGPAPTRTDGSRPGGSVAPAPSTDGLLPGGSLPGGSVAPASSSDGSLPGGSVAPGSSRGGLLPGGLLPGGSLPGGSVAPGSSRDGMLPGGSLPGGLIVPAPLVDGWYTTGDVATIGADGWHRIVGRASTDLIKTGGYRVGAGEVEDALLLHPAVREAAVIGLPDSDLGERITAFVVADPVAEADLIAFVASRLAAHKRPRAVRMVAELPRNAMGKVQKARLRDA